MEREFDSTGGQVYALDVYYDLDFERDIVSQLDKDAVAEAAAGVPMVGAGCGTGSGQRDIEFHFWSAETRAAAKERLRDAGFRFNDESRCAYAASGDGAPTG